MEKSVFLEQIKRINPNANQDLIGRAFDYAQKIYSDKVRMSGQSLFDHCVEIALALTEINLGSPVIAAGLLHEALEKVDIPKEQLEKEFGQEITFLVEGVTNVGKVEHSGAQRTIENLRKLFLATAKDTRVVMIKLVNRLHSLQTLYVFEKEKQQRLAKETLEIYAPIAYRLGMRKISGELEDLSFPIIYPEKHEWLLSQVKDQYLAREKYLQKLTPMIQTALNEAGIFPIELHSRAKRYYSLYKKLMRYEMDLNKIYDLVALRIIVKNIDDCYGALGVIHKMWKPMPGRIKDYIALPKPNGYQSLHTTVFCPGGKITEFQIRTKEMHKEAEYGIAAHWFYSEQKGLRAYIKKFFAKPPEKELEWIKQLRQWQESISSGSPDFLQALKIDFFKDRLFVFTPKGDVIDLPEGATAVDFAYQVHTSVGHRCAGAKADGKMIPLDQPLKNGQVIEIITQKDEKPSEDWIRLVATNQAKSRIKEWFRKKRPQEIIETIKQKVFLMKKPALKPALAPKPVVQIQGETKFMTNLAKCCAPQPSDQIIGYITLNRGVSVHKTDCPNIKRIKKTERLIPVSWKMD